MAEIYSKEDDFGGNIAEGQLHEEILAESGITTTLLGISTDEDVVTIIFESTISSDEKTLLNNIIENHTPQSPYMPKKYIKVSAPDITNAYTNTDVYFIMMSTMLPNQISAKITNIYLTSKSTGNLTSYDVRVYNVTEDKTLATKNLTNTDKAINSMGTISNLPTTTSIIEIHAKRNGGDENSLVWVYDVAFEYE